MSNLIVNDPIPAAAGGLIGGTANAGTTVAITLGTGLSITSGTLNAAGGAGVALTSTVTPLVDGTAAIGAGTEAARSNHVHPTDTSRAPVASPVFTGSVTLASWTAAPATTAGIIGYNSTSGRYEFGIGASVVSHVRLSGDTLTGPLIAAADPTVALGVATKQYVDSKAGTAALPILTIDGATIPGSAGTPYVMQPTDRVVDVNKTTGAATAITLPSAPTIGVSYVVIDGKRDAATNNITVSAPSGATINGAATFVETQNGGAMTYLAVSATAWRII